MILIEVEPFVPNEVAEDFEGQPTMTSTGCND